jgi:leucyl aminopeptidase
MTGGLAYKPGDILTTYSGKTIEVINTDAEGRIILADAFGYCGKNEKVDTIIDMATLTGAASLALGRKYMAGFFTDDKLCKSLHEAGERSGEKIWDFPLDKEYLRDLKSEFADIKNAPIIRQGGTIHGAVFLYYFLETKDIPWAHLDIAPTSWSKEYKGHISFGGTGVTVRMLLEYLADENLW